MTAGLALGVLFVLKMSENDAEFNALQQGERKK
jgi:hypothetical protein